MLTRIRGHVRSNVVGYVALFFTLALGSAYAAEKLAKNSVDSRAIENREVKEKDLAKGAVRTEHIPDGELRSIDLDDPHQTFNDPGFMQVNPGQKQDGTLAQTGEGALTLINECDAQSWTGDGGSVTGNLYVRFVGTGWLDDGSSTRTVTDETVKVASATANLQQAGQAAQGFDIRAVSRAGDMIVANGVIAPIPALGNISECVFPSAGFES